MESAPRGGDLAIRYPDGTIRFLTQEAGYGSSGCRGLHAIAVREPCVHWSGTKALFSMVVGAPTQQYQVTTFYWQIYEVSGLGEGETATIRTIANQPATYNNVSPIYAHRRPHPLHVGPPADGAAHLYPQRDEYESAPTVAGIWSLDEASGDLTCSSTRRAARSRSSLDSFGRVIFTRGTTCSATSRATRPTTAAELPGLHLGERGGQRRDRRRASPAPRSSPSRARPDDPAYSPALVDRTPSTSSSRGS